jgi:hypothetical protein
MPAESIKTRFSGMPSHSQDNDLRILVQAQYDALVAVIAQLGAKLDADATVTDTNYASLAAAAIATKIVP